MSDLHPVLIAGEWRAAASSGTFRGENPATGDALPDVFPVSTWADCDAALDAAVEAGEALRRTPPDEIARFLTRFAERIEARASELVEAAHAETGLARKPRLADVGAPLEQSFLHRLDREAVLLEATANRVAQRGDAAEPLELVPEPDTAFVGDAEPHLAVAASRLREETSLGDGTVERLRPGRLRDQRHENPEARDDRNQPERHTHDGPLYGRAGDSNALLTGGR